ncbi:hypothetical protein Hanom_Chr12g01118001 [Helianthus anomalus]
MIKNTQIHHHVSQGALSRLPLTCRVWDKAPLQTIAPPPATNHHSILPILAHYHAKPLQWRPLLNGGLWAVAPLWRYRR